MAAQGKPGDRLPYQRDVSSGDGPVLIAVAGGSGSGKTMFSRLLCDALGAIGGALLPQDAYYRDLHALFDHDGGAVNFDHPDSIEFALLEEHLRALKAGGGVDVPIYDFVTHSRVALTERLDPVAVVIVDGILILARPELRALFDQTFFVEAPEDLRFRRRLARDTVERGRTAEGVREQFFAQVKPMHDLFVQPSKVHAHQVLDGTRPFTESVAFTAARLLECKTSSR